MTICLWNIHNSLIIILNTINDLYLKGDKKYAAYTKHFFPCLDLTNNLCPRTNIWYLTLQIVALYKAMIHIANQAVTHLNIKKMTYRITKITNISTKPFLSNARFSSPVLSQVANKNVIIIFIILSSRGGGGVVWGVGAGCQDLNADI